MYFELFSNNDINLSYRLYKHPDNIYERTEGNRTFIGKFNVDFKYTIKTIVDEQPILQQLKELNRFSYVTDIPYSVNNYTLPIDFVLRDALRGKLPNDIPQAKHLYQLKMTPFTIKLDGELFNKLNIFIYDETLVNSYTYTYTFVTIQPMYLHEFLQKIYVLVSASTRKSELLSQLTKDTIDKYTKFMVDWKHELSDIEYQKLIRQLTGYSKSLLNHIDEQNDDENNVKVAKLPSTHERRHDIIKNLINSIKTHDKKLNILDLGASTGQLWQGEKNHNITLIEVDSYKIDKLKSKFYKYNNINIIHDNILDLQLTESMLNCDILVLSEVIEHFNLEDRIKIYNLIINTLQPKYIILSTPNKEYNIHYGLEGYRHNDHKVEFTSNELLKELLDNNVLVNYQIQSPNDLLGESNESISFIWAFERRIDYKPIKLTESKPQTFILHHTLTRITDNQLNDGRLSKVMREYGKDNFYFGPTIAPVEWNEKYADVMEHPMSAIEYYNNRGVHSLIVEKKYMGSRAYILYFANKHIASLYGFNKTLYINSRSGYPFFDDENILREIEHDLSKTKLDSILLDCEILPWSIKSKNLAISQFLQPGYCKYIHDMYVGNNTSNVDKYLELVNFYLEEKPIQIHPFNILMYNGEFVMNAQKTYINHTINTTFHKKKYFCYLDWFEYEGGNSDKTKLLNFWNDEIIKYNYEGIVIKPNVPSFTIEGFPIVPALKVRQENYLMLTYGIDYRNYINQLKWRNISKKRLQSIVEHELSQIAVRALCHKKHNINKLALQAFIGIENMNRSYIDATL